MQPRGLSFDTLALITSDWGMYPAPEHQMALITSDCGSSYIRDILERADTDPQLTVLSRDPLVIDWENFLPVGPPARR